MPYIGLEKRIPSEKFIEVLKQLGLKVLKVDEITINTRRKGWIEFNRAEVEGDVKDVAVLLSSSLSAVAFEWGEHTVLGEVSAKLWHEGIRVCFPEGDEELVVAVIHDSFLDVRIPTERVKGIEGRVYLAGRSYTLPLSLRDLMIIINVHRNSIKKIEKLIEVYGKERVLTKETIEYLESIKKRKEKERIEIDYNSGYVISMDSEGKIKTIPLMSFILNILEMEDLERAISIIRSAPEDRRKEILGQLKEEMEIARALGRKRLLELIAKLIDKVSRSS